MKEKKFSSFLNTNMFNSLPSNIILDWSKLKACADDKLNVNEDFKFVL